MNAFWPLATRPEQRLTIDTFGLMQRDFER